MRDRCLNPRNPRYSDYGGRGITIQEDWADFANFLRDMGEAPEGKTLERKKNDFGYSKSNCKWATYGEQNKNKRNNRFVLVNGEKLTFSEAERKLGVYEGFLRQNLARNVGRALKKFPQLTLIET